MNKRFLQVLPRVMAGVFALGCVASLPVFAVLEQKTITGPLLLRFHQNLRSDTVRIGDPFDATVTQTSCYQNACIPQGTNLSGFVMEAQPSRKVHRPGYMDLQVTEVDYPYAQDIIYYNTNSKRNIRLMSPEAYTVKDQLVEQVPSLLGATAVVLPLALASSLGPGAIIPLGFAGAVIASSVQEGVQTARGKAHGNFLEHTGRAVARGAVAPYVAYKATKVSPEAVVNRGDVVALRPGSRFARELYCVSR